MGNRYRDSIGLAKTVEVMDADIATESNFALLKEKGYDYLFVTRSTIKNYLLQGERKEVAVINRLKRKISLQKVSCGKDDDYYLKI
ncbi:MAG: hypothetical protein LBP72_10225 [Dysgonamonadaceae bacterium]|jgi:hypothetical protein|nr:hypothetical protein [Dysgonamonadaceae bacterium]